MGKFARVVELDNGEQVLLSVAIDSDNYDWYVMMGDVFIDGLRVPRVLQKFVDVKVAQLAVQKYPKEKAQAYYDEVADWVDNQEIKY